MTGTLRDTDPGGGGGGAEEEEARVLLLEIAVFRARRDEYWREERSF